MTNGRRFQIVIGLLLALGLPFCHLGTLGVQHSGLGPFFGGEVLWWALFVAVLFYVLLVERRPLSSLGYRAPRISDIALGVSAAFIMFMGTGVIFQVILPALRLNVAHAVTGIGALPLLFRILTVTRAAFVEETLFRGYGFERLAELTRRPLLAGLVTFVLFTLAHLSGGGWGQVIIAAWGGLILTALYMWRRNIWATITARWLTDGAAFILLPLLMAHHH